MNIEAALKNTDKPTAEIDGIVVDPDSIKWLSDSKRQLMPSQWKLQKDEIRRILDHRILLTVFFCPVYVFKFPPPEALNGVHLHYVFIGADLLERSILTREEVIAVCLHEIGHKVNVFTSKHTKNTPEWHIEHDIREKELTAEDDADDYAIHCKYGEQLAKALEGLRNSGALYFDKRKIQQRIDRIRSSPELNLYFQ